MIGVNHSISNWVQQVDTIHGRVKPPPRRGRPYVYSTTVLLRCYLLMLVCPSLRSYAALHTYLSQHPLVGRLVGLPSLPHRTTLMRRFKVLEQPLKARIWAMGLAFLMRGYAEAHVLMADGTLHWASGPVWHRSQQQRGELPSKVRHIDRAAGWGRSPYHGYVWGYRSHPVLALTPDLEVVPILADAAPADVQDATLLHRQLPWLPEDGTALLLDRAYDSRKLHEGWERTNEYGVTTRWIVSPILPRRGRISAWRHARRVRQRVTDVELYRLRGRLMEPFFAHWKAAFDLKRVPLQGVAARVYLLLALYAYQLLLWDNMIAHRPTYAYQHLVLDGA